MSKNQRKTCYLVDAFSLIFQVFHAIRGMSSPTGLPTNALFGFTRDLLYLRNQRKPDYLLVALDGERPTFRHKIYPEYKANRSEMPEELRLQIPHIKELLEAMRVATVLEEGYEADDIVATIANHAKDQDIDVFICTSDKDCRQLITDHVKLFNLRKNTVYDRTSLQEDWGISPEQVIDLQSMVGDSVDNVPGVPGVGVKTAAQLLQEYGTVEKILQNIDNLKGPKRRDAFRDSADKISQSRELVTLNTNVPMKLDWDQWQIQPMNAQKLEAKFKEWGFHRFAEEVRQQSRKEADSVEGFLFPVDDNPWSDKKEESPPAKPPTQSHLIDNETKFVDFYQKCLQQKKVAVSLQTSDADAMACSLVGLAFSWQEGEGWYLPLKAPSDVAVLNEAETLAALQAFFSSESIKKVGHDIKFSTLVLRNRGIILKGIHGDAMIADYLLHAGERLHDLPDLVRRHLPGFTLASEFELRGKAGVKQKEWQQIPLEGLCQYACQKVDAIWQLCDFLRNELDQIGLIPLLDKLEIPLAEVLAEMEFNGITIDVELLNTLSNQLGGELEQLEKSIHQFAGEEFNIASVKQLRDILFGKLHLPTHHKTDKGEASTDQETLEWLASEHQSPIAESLLLHRQLSKLKGTYIDALPKLILPKSGRLHASFNQTVAATGRLSSSEPNLQNIPIRSEIGGQIRQAFLPRSGWRLIAADYSQIELRFLAHFSRDRALLDAFANDRDIHTAVAAQINGVSEENVTTQMRRTAKMVNFGVIYGMSGYGLAQRLQIRKVEADSFIEAYFAKYPNVLRYQDELLKDCRKNGFVATIMGRRRSFAGSVIRKNSTYVQRNQAEREAINMQIQGSAADLIKVAMLQIYEKFNKEKCQSKLLLQIHDELVFEVPDNEINAVSTMIISVMTDALKDKLNVPLKVDARVGLNWLDTEPVRV